MLPWKRPEKKAPDYKQRWPTQQTLVVPADTPKRMRVLHAISIPLAWLNIKVEQWQGDLDEHGRSIERFNHPDPPLPRKRLFGILKPGKSTHPYDTDTGPTPMSKSLPAVDNSRLDSSQDPDSESSGRRPPVWRKYFQAKTMPESGTGQNNQRLNQARQPAPHPSTVPDKNPEIRRRWSRFLYWKPAPSALRSAEQQQYREGDRSGDIEPPRKRRAAWKSVNGRRSTPHPHPPPHPPPRNAPATQQVVNTPGRKNKQKVTVDPVSTTDARQSAPGSPIIRFLSSFVRHSTSSREHISPLDINSSDAQATTLSSPRPRNQETPSSGMSSTPHRVRAWFSSKQPPQRQTPISAPITAEDGTQAVNRCPACGYCKPAESPRPKPARALSITSLKDTWFKSSRKRSRTQ